MGGMGLRDGGGSLFHWSTASPRPLWKGNEWSNLPHARLGGRDIFVPGKSDTKAGMAVGKVFRVGLKMRDRNVPPP